MEKEIRNVFPHVPRRVIRKESNNNRRNNEITYNRTTKTTKNRTKETDG